MTRQPRCVRRAYPPIRRARCRRRGRVTVPGRGELFLRDTGGDGPPVMLLHGWMASADLNWHGAYEPLVEAGYRVLAIDHRGHGRGTAAAGAVPARRLRRRRRRGGSRTLGLAPATFVGYSMGGAIAQLIARDHRDVVAGVVLSGTASTLQDPRDAPGLEVRWASSALALSVAPRATWSAGFRRAGLPVSPRDRVVAVGDDAPLGARHRRGGPRAGPLRLAAVAARRSASRPRSVITTRDRRVAPRKQRELAAAIGATVFEAPIDHLEVTAAGAESTTRRCCRRSRRSARRRAAARAALASRPRSVTLSRLMRRRSGSSSPATLRRRRCSTFAPDAFARDDGGQGWCGETTDKEITNAMFIVIAFFPARDPGLLTLIQWRLDKRKHARMDAAKRARSQRRLARRLVSRSAPTPEHHDREDVGEAGDRP